MISGGRYAGNNLPCQEFAILPIGNMCENIQTKYTILTFRIFDHFSCIYAGAESFADAVKMATEIYRVLEKKIIDAQEIQGPLPVSDEGAFVPNLKDDKVALTLLNASIKDAGYEGKIKIALDMAASAFYKEGPTIFIFFRLHR